MAIFLWALGLVSENKDPWILTNCTIILLLLSHVLPVCAILKHCINFFKLEFPLTWNGVSHDFHWEVGVML